jgi:alpha-tubulin suppressor-like RCC1 family protein
LRLSPIISLLPSSDLQLSPVKCLVSEATAVAAGADFTGWIAGGKVMAAGNPQYGQLGDGSDHAYNSKDCEEMMIATLDVCVHLGIDA